MKFCTYIRIRKLSLIILPPFITLYFSGFIGMKMWYDTVWKLHEKAHKENKTNEWFAKKCISLYLRVVLFSMINIASWVFTIYFLTK